jgi:hypothetical protein
MAADRSYIAENDRERRRLEALVGKLDDAALSRPMPDGWTVASVLADQRGREADAAGAAAAPGRHAGR